MAQQLASAYEVPYLAEYAREYIGALKQAYTYEDVIAIAREQRRREDELAINGHSRIFFDTDLLVLQIWLQDKFQSVPEWITQAITPQRYDLFLLMYPDLPWQADVQREDAERLNELFSVYESALHDHNLAYRVVQGKGEARLQNAVKALVKFEGL